MVKTKEFIARLLSEPQNAHLRKLNSGRLASKLGVKEKLIIETREYMKNLGSAPATIMSTGKTVEEKVDVEKGTTTVTKFVSSIPPTLSEVKSLFHIDDINTRLITYWNKAVSGGFYLSCHIKVLNSSGSDFDIDERIKSALSNVKPLDVKKPNRPASENLLMIIISDDHAGLVIKNSLFENEYSGQIYSDRLDKILKEASKLDEVFEQVVVLRLGDELDGWNAETTRGGHKLGSLSNEEQFDIYTSANMSFYDGLFSSGLGYNYKVINVVNSNHTGNGLSYMVNKSLEFYIKAKFPIVEFSFEKKFIGHFEWHNHVIAFTHGKDESTRKKPMPYNLDKDTDLYLCEYFDSKDYSLKKTYITLYKGDLHQFGLNSGKFGYYVNCPSVAGSSSYTEMNYGSVNPAALLAVHKKDSRTPILITVDFNSIDE
jgi:hypothetical protein